ncbi:hypothetical protein RSSM_03426 [Rhodopirellula sallentina SM41]|uniref:Uncharacterized protein n=1 Tax=Rhodopirellula sallentina SM41 TaxID=1263870 RepID=M5U0X5_9BACT|nr:hypothetical protein RSSM_03426 [Rhodopirellula sallentina SM41]
MLAANDVFTAELLELKPSRLQLTMVKCDARIVFEFLGRKTTRGW